MKQKSISMGLAVIVATALPASLSAESQDSVRHLGELVVSAEVRRLETSLNKLPVPMSQLPISLSTLSGKELQIRGITKLETALRYSPGVNVRTTYGGFNQISIRGFDHSIMMVDGIRDERSSISNSYPTGDLSQIESLEVLKGPASVLYGYSVVGGIVNVVRKAPKEERSLSARLSYGSWGYHDLSLSGGGRIAPGLNLYLGGFFSGGDQWRSTHDKRRSLYGALGYNKGVHQLTLRLGWRNDYYGTEAGLPKLMPEDMYRTSDGSLFAKKYQLREGIDRSWRYNHSADFMKNPATDLSLHYNLRLGGDWKLTNNLAYSYDDIDYLSTEGMNYPTSDQPIYPYYSQDAKGGKTYYDLDKLWLNELLRFQHVAKTLNEQLELKGSLRTGGIRHSLLLGASLSYFDRASYSGYESNDLWGNGVGSVISVFKPESVGEVHSKLSEVNLSKTWSYGIYASDVLELSKRLRAMLSLRYDHFSYRYALARVTDGKHAYDTPQEDAWQRTRTSALSYRIGLVYTPQEEISFFGSLGSFYIPDRTLSLYPRTEYYNALGERITQPKDGRYFEPTTGYQYELGVKYDVASRISILLSAFNTLRRNEILRIGSYTDTSSQQNINIIAQVGQTESSGFEAELQYSPTKRLHLSAGYGYTNARIAKLQSNALTSKYPATNQGAELSYVPKHTLYSYGSYHFDRGFAQGLALNYSLSYRSSMYYNYSARLAFSPRTILDLGAEYQLSKHLKLGLQVKNILNYQGYDSVLGTQLFPSEPTNFVASISYQL